MTTPRRISLRNTRMTTCQRFCCFRIKTLLHPCTLVSHLTSSIALCLALCLLVSLLKTFATSTTLPNSQLSLHWGKMMSSIHMMAKLRRLPSVSLSVHTHYLHRPNNR
eukprot:PhF_6_TR28115/c0_g1_i1/m.41589